MYKYRKCPGCGKEYPMPAQAICEGCKHLLKTASDLQAREERRIAEGEKVIVRLGTDWRFLGPKFINVLPSSFGPSDANRIARAIAAVSAGTKHDFFTRYQRSVSSQGDGHTGMIWIEVTHEQADAMEELCNALHDYCLELAENVAKREHSFLLRIAEGEVSINQINEHSIKVKE